MVRKESTILCQKVEHICLPAALKVTNKHISLLIEPYKCVFVAVSLIFCIYAKLSSSGAHGEFISTRHESGVHILI